MVPCEAVETVVERGIVEEGEVHEAGQVDGIYASGLGMPDGEVAEQTGQIRMPGQARSLDQESKNNFWIAKSGVNSGFFGVLIVDFPTILDEIPGYE